MQSKTFKMIELEKIELILEKLKDFEIWKEFKNDPNWLKRELEN